VTIAHEAVKPATADPQGLFRIIVDRNEKNIIALHFATPEAEKPTTIVKGETAKAIYSKIMEMGLATRLDHTAYLGSELAKAEVALKTGKEYIQDRTLFNELLPRSWLS